MGGLDAPKRVGWSNVSNTCSTLSSSSSSLSFWASGSTMIAYHRVNPMIETTRTQHDKCCKFELIKPIELLSKKKLKHPESGCSKTEENKSVWTVCGWFTKTKPSFWLQQLLPALGANHLPTSGRSEPDTCIHRWFRTSDAPGDTLLAGRHSSIQAFSQPWSPTPSFCPIQAAARYSFFKDWALEHKSTTFQLTSPNNPVGWSGRRCMFVLS